jgi:hypothetical protein
VRMRKLPAFSLFSPVAVKSATRGPNLRLPQKRHWALL